MTKAASASAAPESLSAPHDPVFDAVPVSRLPDDEPRTPVWLPITGALLGLALLVFLLVGGGESAPAESRTTGRGANAAPTASARAPSAARPAPAAARGGQPGRRADIDRVRKGLLQARRAARAPAGTASGAAAGRARRAGVRPSR